MNCETRAREGSSLVHIRPPGTNDVCGTWVLCDQDGVRLAGHIEPLHRSSADKLFSAAEKTKEPAFDSSNNWEQLRHALQDQGSPIVVDITVGTAMQSWMIATWPHSESLYLCLPCSRSDADTTFNAAAMSLLGRQTAQVVHELNNTLDGILRYVNLSLRAAESDAPPSVAQYLQESRAGLHRMVDIISDLLAFSRRSQDQSPPEQV
ncbi:MAG: histidine kinase dimerization/phospho-acceptor domain-containing protein, partial [Phycisphaerae bacterium]